MTLRFAVCLLPLAAVSALAGAVAAQTPPNGGGMGLPPAAEEVEAWAGRLFARLDANQDGAVTGDELAVLANPTVSAMGGSRLRAMVVQSDADRNARISAEEMTAGAQRMFSRMDRDGDGRLSEDERPQRPARAAPVVIPPADPMPFPDTPDGG
ncbi:MAG: EF-hand domain-containing protein [Brevundimonas sp.]